VIRMGIIGYGYWGPNIVRNFMETEGAEVVKVCDSRPDRLDLVRKRYPSVGTTSDISSIMGDPGIDAVAVATPVGMHYEMAMAALKAGKHVFVEKPLTDSTETARRLVDEADTRGLVLMVDHTFIYTGAVQKLRQITLENGLGRVLYYDSVRINLGLFQHDVNVMWDLAVHDLAIMDWVLPGRPLAVSATGVSHFPPKPENMAYVTVYYPDGLLAHIHVNWMAPVKIRRTVVGGTSQMVVYDDLEPSEKIKVYDKGVDIEQNGDHIYKMLVSYRSGDMHAPKLDGAEALSVEARQFLDCIRNKKVPSSDGHAGLRIVELLEAAGRSMHRIGQVIELPEGRMAA
jgi:predicted dehydrogenase